MPCLDCWCKVISRAQPGVERVEVSLERGEATVGYDWSVIDQDLIAGRGAVLYYTLCVT